jgi:hypothetical protein
VVARDVPSCVTGGRSKLSVAASANVSEIWRAKRVLCEETAEIDCVPEVGDRAAF